jgi:hypothetical protein
MPSRKNQAQIVGDPSGPKARFPLLLLRLNIKMWYALLHLREKANRMARQFHTSVRQLIAVLSGSFVAGIGCISIREYFLACFFWLVCSCMIGVFFWPNPETMKRWPSRIGACLSGLIFFGVMAVWTIAYMGDEPWTNLARMSSIYKQVPTAEKQITPEPRAGQPERQQVQHPNQAKKQDIPSVPLVTKGKTAEDLQQEPTQLAKSGPADPAVKLSWRTRLRQGMSKVEVESIFGKADKISVTGSLERWEYGEGEVSFYEGKLYAWYEPDQDKTPPSKDNQGLVDPKNKTNWRKHLRVGMTAEEVLRLFGEPDRISTSGDIQIWSYGHGSITLREAKVRGWMEPD